MCAATMENSIEVPQKIKNRTAMWPNNSTTVYISRKKKENTNSKSHMHPNAHSHDMEASQVSINSQMDKENLVYIYNEM